MGISVPVLAARIADLTMEIFFLIWKVCVS
jgi:hypothetical protein